MTIKNKDISISKLLENKKVVMTISIICAVVFWGIINISQSPNITKDIHNIPVSISVEGTVAESMGLDVVGGGEDRVVTVSVAGPRYIVAGLSADDISVTAMLDNVTTAGNQTITLSATRASDKIGYSIVEISPSTITLMVDNFDTRVFDVQVKAIGAAAAEGLICDTPVVSADKYSQIVIKGPKSQLDKVISVVAEAQVNATLSETKTYDAAIKLYDINGKELDASLFTIDKPTVNIIVPIFKSKEVPLRAQFKNAPAAYSGSNIGYNVSIKSVTVYGRGDEIDALEFIPLAPIDFGKITEGSRKFKCTLDIPNGMRLSEEIAEVEVTITTALTEKTIGVSEFKAQGLSSGLRMSVTEKVPKEITLCTSGADISKITDKDVFGVVDLTGYAAGEYNVPLKIAVQGRDNVWAVYKDSGYTLRIKVY